MNNLPIDAAVAQFKERLGKGLKEVQVPEWPQQDGTPTVLYFGAENTEQRDEYFPLMRENKFEGFVQFLVVRARTVDGKPAFRPADAVTLRKRVDPDVIVQIVGRANKALGEEVPVDTAEKS